MTTVDDRTLVKRWAVARVLGPEDEAKALEAEMLKRALRDPARWDVFLQEVEAEMLQDLDHALKGIH